MKNYVKEYKGFQVPEGATHCKDLSMYPHVHKEIEFYDASSKPFKYYGSNGEWGCSTSISLPVDSFELPEATQNWNGEGLPPIGTLCTISADGFEYLFSAASNELSSITESTELVVIGHCARHDNGAKCVTLMATDSTAARGFTTVNPDFITPLKTQQEKDREAFINAARKATNADENDIVATDIFDDMFHAGFTAPKDEK